MAKKSNTQRGAGRWQRDDRARKPTATANMYGTLQEPHSDEMNIHLVERFSRMSFAAGPEERAPAPQPIRPSKDIREYFTAPKTPVTGGAWLNRPEIPSPSEIMSSPFTKPDAAAILNVADELRPNKVEGAYASKGDYLGTQYELLREDTIRPLRQAVEQIRNNSYGDESDYADLGVYEPVYIKSLIFSPRGIATRVAFSLGRVKKHIRWKQSKRLITGTLVALSPSDDCFRRKCILATVAARPLAALDQNPPEIDLFFARPEDMEIDPTQKWVMVEARSSFYEAGRHTMLALQHMMYEPFPMSSHLVEAQRNVAAPAYLQSNPHVDMRSLVAIEEQDDFANVNVLEQWPDPKSHGLDKSQSQALRRIITKRLAIVQGPPGTGKTHVSIVALKLLLDRKDDSPIIVTAQTNHATDQILRHVAEFEPNFVRLGGRSKDKDVIKKRTLSELRSATQQRPSPGSLKSQAHGQMKKLTSKMRTLLAPLELNKPPISHRLLFACGLISQKQADSLEDISAMGMSSNIEGVHMEQWLGQYLVRCDHPLRPDDFGDDYEDEEFEVEQLEELEAEATSPDDDFDILRGEVMLLSDNQTGSGFLPDDDIRSLLTNEGKDDLYGIPARKRGPVYRYFQREVKRMILKDFREYAKQYEGVVPNRKIGLWEQDLQILREARLIGMTTTGLSKYRGLIAALKPKIILVEEAAETLEAPVTVACLPSLEHLILVGDHQQLRPHCQLREFEDKPYYFNLSLFERMVLNGVELDTLTRQRRMIPEVRRLLEPIYGKTLKDHVSVTDVVNRPPVEGMGGCNSFFFHHEWPEEFDANHSARNVQEAKMIVGFLDYLILNSVDAKKITILTFYNGQRKLINKEIALHPNIRHYSPQFSVVTVDSYQGEENDIVLLSLVRSNKKRKIGFLDVDNRVCVALSRAKRGFYIFGNALMLACESAIWGEVVEIMYGKKTSKQEGKRRHVGFHLPLQCTNHDRKTFIQEPDDWELVNGGCELTCRCQLPCGHTCMLRCHPFDKTEINCTQKCTKRLEGCGHVCSGLCCDPCKCLICERRSNGSRALVKGTSRPLPTPSALPPFFTMPVTPEASECSKSVENWNAYANGGACADDAEYMRLKDEETAQYLETVSQGSPEKLIDISPKKKKKKQEKSVNADLLVDLDVSIVLGTNNVKESSSQGCANQAHSYAAAAGGKKRRQPMNLLD